MARRFDVETALVALLVVIVVGSVLAVGTVHPPVLAALAALSTLAMALALWLRLRRPRSRILVGPAVVFALLAGYTMLQLVPLPLGWLKVIAPANADVWARCLEPLGQAPNFAPLTLDPPASWFEVLRWFSYGAVFFAATEIALRRGAIWAVALVCGSALLAGLTSIAHGLVGADKVFGLYEPSFRPQPWHVGPLLNPNNLSGYLNLGILCGLGLLLSRRKILPRWAIAVAVAVIVGVNVTSASRAGVVLLPLAALGFALTVEFHRRRRGHSPRFLKRPRLLMLAIGAFGVLLASLGGTEKIWRELFSENVEKFKIVGWVEPLVGDFAWLGIGRGAFESVSPAYQPQAGGIVYTHAENFVVQWGAEWGLPVAVAALLAFGWYFRPRSMGVGRSVVAAGAWFGVLAVLVQNLVDLGLEIPGLCFGLVVVLGALWGDQVRVSKARGEVLPKRTYVANRWALATVVVGLGLIVATYRVGWRDVAADRLFIKRQLERESPPREPERRVELRNEIRGAILRHPAEPYFPLMGAWVAWQEKDANPMPWLQRALERALINGKAHLLLAQLLKAHGAQHQALMELRLATTADPQLSPDAAKLAVQWSRSIDELLVAVPSGRDGIGTLDLMGRLLDNQAGRELRISVDREALKRDSSLPGPRVRLAEDLIRAVATGSGCPDQALCAQQVEAHAALVAAALPFKSAAYRLRARWLVAIGQVAEAERLLTSRCQSVDDPTPCFRELVRAASKLKPPEPLAAATRKLRTHSCATPTQCAETNTWIGDLHVGRGEWGHAMTSYRQAVREEPNEARLLKLAKAASKTGQPAQALRALERVLRLRRNPDPKLEERIKRERARIMEALSRDRKQP